MKNILLTLSFLGCAGLTLAWFAPTVMEWHENVVQTSQTAMVTENLIKDSGFDNADFSKDDTTPTIYGEWVTHNDPNDKDKEGNPKSSYTLTDDTEKGKVGSFTGKPSSYFKAYFAQHVSGVAKKGIYRISFWGKSADGGKAKLFIGAGNKHFIKKNGLPTDPDKKWYGTYHNPTLTNEWKEYSEDFDFTKVVDGGMYGVYLKDVLEADDTDRSNICIYFQGDLDNKNILIDDVKLELVEDLSGSEDPNEPGKNILKDSDFESNPDLTLREEEPDPLLYGQWIARRDVANEKKTATIALKEDAAQGKVVAMSGKPTSYYTTYMSQRIEGTLPAGIYRLSFLGRSDNNGSLRVLIRTTGADGKGTFFIKETGKPSDPSQKWYGGWQAFTMPATWTEQYVDFNLSKTASSAYQWTFNDGLVLDATDAVRTSINICIQGNSDNQTAYIDNVKFTKIADIDEEEQKLVVQYDFEEEKLPATWKATGSALELSKEHFKKGVQSLCWNATDKATLELTLGGDLKVNEQNAAKFYIHGMAANNDTIYAEFLDAANKVVKKATMLANFKGWREFSRSYAEYENTESAVLRKVRFIYKTKSGNGQKISFDDVDFNYFVDGGRRYPDMLALDVDYLNPQNTDLLQAYSFGVSVVPSEPTTEEIADFNKLKTQFHQSAGSVSGGVLRGYINKVNSMNIVRNNDGTVTGDPMPSANDVTVEYLSDLSAIVEGLAASSNAQAKVAFKDLVDHIIDQGVLYNSEEMIWYGEKKEIPARILRAMDAFTDEQKKEMIKAAKWMIKFNLAYAPSAPRHYISSDYIYLNLPNLYGCAANYPEQNVAIESMRVLTHMLEKSSEYDRGGQDILKPDGTGFHHSAHYNNYMYAYGPWVEYIGKLKGSCFRINKEAYERIKKAVISIYIMATKSFLTANSLAGRHPLFGGNSVPFSKEVLKTLVEVGGDIMDTGIDAELASCYNYFASENFYEGVPQITMDGFYQFNYSPIGVYRQNNWVATMRCPTTKFWGGEIYSGTNRFGRYQSHGTLEIMYDGVRENSGLPTSNTGGWDWNVEAGATTVHYTSWKEMMPDRNLTSRFDQYSKTTNFSGALSWKEYGMFGAEFDQGDSWGSQRFTPTNLAFKKSVYAFDGMLISLGSNISTSGSYDDGMITATNLFQGIDAKVSGDLIVGGTVMAVGTEPKRHDSTSDLWMVTPQGTGYFVPKGNDPVVIKHGEQSSPNETGADLDTPPTVVAAKAYIDHGVKTSGKKYVFVAVPATNATDMAQLATKMGNNGGEIYEIKAQNEKLHALTYKPAHITAYSVFTAVENLDYGYVKSTASEMLLMEQYNADKEMLSLAVCNPNLRPEAGAYGWTTTPTETSIVVKGEWKLNQNVDGVILTLQADKTTKIDLTLAAGEPVYLDLIDKDAVGIENVNSSDDVKVYVAGHDVYVVNAVGSVLVYNVAGQFIRSLEADGTAHFTLDEPGCYIVKVNNKPVKVMIK